MFKICAKVSDLQKLISDARAAGKSIGFVPTMGALHQGHLSLIRQSHAENGLTVCSIFVNPIQFNDPKDYALYPRTLERDAALLESAGCDVLFAPTEEEIYPDASFRQIDFDPGPLATMMEGRSRPGHFAGMVAVVKRLFDIVKPDKAYFGQKDYQQYRIIQAMANYYHLPVEIVRHPIVREPSGLAMSSRNERLSPEERQRAALIYKVLRHAAEKIQAGGKALDRIRDEALAEFGTDRNFTVDYFDICSANTLLPVHDKERANGPLVICTAVVLGNVRLIDNLLVE